MSASVQYTALRSLFDAALGSVVTYSLPIRYAGMTRGKRTNGAQRKSLSGIRETYHQATEYTYRMETIPLDAAGLARVRQFLDSVEQGEEFLFAADGGTAFSAAYLEGWDYDEIRSPDRDDLISVGFSVSVP